MIKRFWFAGEAAESPWIHLARGLAASAAPVRLVTCAPVEHPGPSWPRVGGRDVVRVDIAWFDDAAHLARFDAATDGATLEGVVALDAEELVLRGAPWLQDRWADPAPRFKHVAMALRRPSLTADELSTRWAAHAGTVGATAIPDEVRGAAYAQNHPLRGAAHPAPPVDALNEAWFDDLASLRARMDWFECNAREPADDDLFGERGFLGVEERVVALD